MRCLIVMWLILNAVAVQAEGIVEVLQRSQQTRLDAMHEVDAASAAVQTVQASFDVLVRKLKPGQPVELRVTDGNTVAETLLGRVVVANVSLAVLPEAERQFVLAHELGHVMMGHQAQMGSLYRKWVPGAVMQTHTDSVAGQLGREASALAYTHEFSADAFALRTLCTMGHSRDEVVALFMSLGVYRDTATHPGTAKRMAALRAVETAQREGTLALAR